MLNKKVMMWFMVFFLLLTSHLFAGGVSAPPSPDKKSTKEDLAGQTTASENNQKLVSHILQQMGATYEGIQSYEAEFKQETFTLALQRKKESSGKFYFQKPDKMRWQYLDPEERDIYLKGEQIQIYLPSRGQVIKQTLNESLPGIAPTRLFMGVEELAQSFGIELIPSQESHMNGAYCLRLKPKQKGGMAVDNILLWIGKKDFFPVMTESEDILGNRTKLTFTKGKGNVPLEEKLFNFQIPPGVEIIEDAF